MGGFFIGISKATLQNYLLARPLRPSQAIATMMLGAVRRVLRAGVAPTPLTVARASLPLLVRYASGERAGKVVKPGGAIVLDGVPHRVSRIMQGKRGKGGAFVRAFLKNLDSGQLFEKTFTVDDMVEPANLETEIYQYSWNDGNVWSFLNAQTFEEAQVGKDCMDPATQFLVEGLEVRLLKFRGNVIGVELPRICEFDVLSIDHSGPSGSGFHSAVLNCGVSVSVPLFISEGMRIRVNVYDAEYVERA